MKFIQKIIPVALSICLMSCLGDKKVVNVSEIGDSSFVNKNFKGNLVNYAEGMSACDKISAIDIAKLYNASADLIHIEDPTKSDRYKKDLPPTCMIYLKTGASDFEWLRGSIGLKREIGKDEFMGDVAQAAGMGKDWEEAWSLKKSISKSSEWLPNMGMAALWNASKKQLEIKFDGYTLTVIPLKNRLNAAEKTAKRDYKKIAIAMVKAAGYIN